LNTCLPSSKKSQFGTYDSLNSCKIGFFFSPPCCKENLLRRKILRLPERLGLNKHDSLQLKHLNRFPYRSSSSRYNNVKATERGQAGDCGGRLLIEVDKGHQPQSPRSILQLPTNVNIESAPLAIFAQHSNSIRCLQNPSKMARPRFSNHTYKAVSQPPREIAVQDPMTNLIHYVPASQLDSGDILPILAGPDSFLKALSATIGIFIAVWIIANVWRRVRRARMRGGGCCC
jgi:hypothetical protein